MSARISSARSRVDNEDGELCYQFQMAILEMDLEDA